MGLNTKWAKHEILKFFHKSFVLGSVLEQMPTIHVKSGGMGPALFYQQIVMVWFLCFKNWTSTCLDMQPQCCVASPELSKRNKSRAETLPADGDRNFAHDQVHFSTAVTKSRFMCHSRHVTSLSSAHDDLQQWRFQPLTYWVPTTLHRPEPTKRRVEPTTM